MRFALLVSVALLFGVLVAAPLPSASADTQYCTLYSYGKTYRNNWGFYPLGPITSGWGWGGAWGGTYNDDEPIFKQITLETWAWDGGFWGWGWDWRGWTIDSVNYETLAPVETDQYNDRHTRGSSNHRDDTNYCYWTTSDGF